MTKLNTINQPLSFRFSREADETEKLLIYRLFNSLKPNNMALLKEIAHFSLTGIFSFILVGPVVFLILYFLQSTLQTPLIVENLPLYALACWVSGYTIYCFYRHYLSRHGVLTSLRALYDDFNAGIIIEEAWQFIEAVCYHAPETGKRYYLVRSDDNMSLFFHEELLIGRLRRIDEADFSAAPIDMMIIRGEKSQRLIRAFVSGPALAVSGHYTLQNEPPLHGAIIDLENFAHL